MLLRAGRPTRAIPQAAGYHANGFRLPKQSQHIPKRVHTKHSRTMTEESWKWVSAQNSPGTQAVLFQLYLNGAEAAAEQKVNLVRPSIYK